MFHCYHTERFKYVIVIPSELQGVFMKNLFSNVIGTEKNTIIFVKTVNQHNVDWSLGAALATFQLSVFTNTR